MSRVNTARATPNATPASTADVSTEVSSSAQRSLDAARIRARIEEEEAQEEARIAEGARVLGLPDTTLDLVQLPDGPLADTARLARWYRSLLACRCYFAALAGPKCSPDLDALLGDDLTLRFESRIASTPLCREPALLDYDLRHVRGNTNVFCTLSEALSHEHPTPRGLFIELNEVRLTLGDNWSLAVSARSSAPYSRHLWQGLGQEMLGALRNACVELSERVEPAWGTQPVNVFSHLMWELRTTLTGQPIPAPGKVGYPGENPHVLNALDYVPQALHILWMGMAYRYEPAGMPGYELVSKDPWAQLIDPFVAVFGFHPWWTFQTPAA